MLDLIKKGITLQEVRKTVTLTKKAGIQIRASFILGLPTETRQESLQTIRFARSLGVSQVRFALATPFPGTKLWDIAQEEGMLDFHDWRQFSLMAGYAKGKPIYSPKGRNPRELAWLQRYANLTFFLHPRVLWIYMRRIKDWKSLRDIVLGGIKFIRASLFPDG